MSEPAIRIWYQSFGHLGRAKLYNESLLRLVQRSGDPGTTITVRGLEKGVGIADNYRYLEHLETAEVVANGVEAAQSGFDAFAIGNIFDPGLRDLREAVAIPVLGLCETAAHLATMMGTGFSLVTVNDKFIPRVLENLDRYGLRRQLVSVEKMRIDWLPDLEDAFVPGQARDNLRGQFMCAAEAGLAKGAETVIPAGGVIMAFLADQDIHAVGCAPIVNGVIALVKMAEMAVRMKRLTGHFTSKQLTYAPPRGAMLEKM